MLEFPYIPVCMETATLAKDLRKHPIPAEWQVFPKQRSGRSISATYITQLEFFVLERTSLWRIFLPMVILGNEWQESSNLHLSFLQLDLQKSKGILGVALVMRLWSIWQARKQSMLWLVVFKNSICILDHLSAFRIRYLFSPRCWHVLLGLQVTIVAWALAAASNAQTWDVPHRFGSWFTLRGANFDCSSLALL